MVQVVFTPNLQRHVACPPTRVTGSAVAESLECVFRDNPTLRRYVLDVHGVLRKNMVIFVDGHATKNRCTLWISPNGGEQWQCISNHLPPIYSVRFDN
jgi:hypothetical protein